MERSERARLKRVANDAVIATFGCNGRESELATALERSVEELEFIADQCEVCKECPTHGDHDLDAVRVDPDEVMLIHGNLKKQLMALKEFRIRLAKELADAEDASAANDLAEIIEEVEGEVDELEVVVTGG